MKINIRILKKIIKDELEHHLREQAPPGREKQVKKLKQEFCGGKDDCPKAFAVAWSQYNKSKSGK